MEKEGGKGDLGRTNDAFWESSILCLWLFPRHVFKSKKMLVFGAMEDIRNGNIQPEAKAHPSCFHPSNSFW